MNHFKNTFSDNRGMAMIVVLTLSFLVIATVGVGATLLVSNLEKTSSRASYEKAKSNAQSGLERLRGMQGIDPSLLDACSANDCVDTASSGCGVCADTIYSSGDNRHQVKITAITHPTATPTAGTATFLATGFYKNLINKRTSVMCLNYCSISSRNCGTDGCSGSCGTCTPPDTCAGGGSPGVCGATCPGDVGVECNYVCANGDSCGGGTVIDQTNHIVAVLGGCYNIDGSGCGGGTDTLIKIWDANKAAVTGATDQNDGRENAITLGDPPSANYEAAKFCDDLDYQGFTDWYLPAKNELLTTLSGARGSGYTTDYAAGCYWSSTEVGADLVNSWDVDAAGGCTDEEAKSNEFYIRCIRRF